MGYHRSRQQTVFANRTRVLRQDLTRLRLITSLLVRDDGGAIQYDYDIAGGSMGCEIFDQVAAPDYPRPLEAIRDTAVALLTAGSIEPGDYDCICAPDVSGTVAQRALGTAWKRICSSRAAPAPRTSWARHGVGRRDDV